MTIMSRKPRKCGKRRGKRRHGHGNIKNRRGAGNRGGRGNAGLNKQHFTYITAHNKEYFGKKGFNNPTKKVVPTINLFEIENMVKANKLEQKDGKYVFEFKGKVLGCGTLSAPVEIKALAWSKSAEDKIKTAGGSIAALEA